MIVKGEKEGGGKKVVQNGLSRAKRGGSELVPGSGLRLDINRIKVLGGKKMGIRVPTVTGMRSVLLTPIGNTREE